ncbi:MAG: hypothetical protein ACRBN8_22635 [Nannocystales bacterium]
MSAHRLNKSVRGDHYVLIGPYDQALISKLRELVPATHREWRPVAKCWRIREPHDQTVRDLIGEQS